MLETPSCHCSETTTGGVPLPVGRLGPVWSQGAGRGACGIKRGPRVGKPLREGPARLAGCVWGPGGRAGVLEQSWLPASPPRRGSSLSLSAIQVFGPSPRCLHGAFLFSQPPKQSQVVATLLPRRLFQRDLSGIERMSALYH